MHSWVSPACISPVALREKRSTGSCTQSLPSSIRVAKFVKAAASLTVYSPGPIVTSTQFALPSNISGSGLLPVTVKVNSSGESVGLPTSLQTDNVADSSSGGSISTSFAAIAKQRNLASSTSFLSQSAIPADESSSAFCLFPSSLSSSAYAAGTIVTTVVVNNVPAIRKTNTKIVLLLFT